MQTKLGGAGRRLRFGEERSASIGFHGCGRGCRRAAGATVVGGGRDVPLGGALDELLNHIQCGWGIHHALPERLLIGELDAVIAALEGCDYSINRQSGRLFD